MSKVKNPHVFLDISIGGGRPDRITFEVIKLAASVMPLLLAFFYPFHNGSFVHPGHGWHASDLISV
jgi:hypothetical protein